MERNREVRRASIVGSNGFNRRRHRTNMLKNSADGDGVAELQESVRLRDRTKKDRERERETERNRDLRERPSRNKRRGERLTSNRDDIGGDETSEESLNDDDDYEENEDTRLIPMAAAISNHSHHSSLTQQYSSNNNTNSVVSSNHLHHRKSFPPASSSSSSSKVFKAAPVWKPDEIISVSVPRKARSASTKRSHDWNSTSSNNYSIGGGEQVHWQDSSSPTRQGGISTPARMSPLSSSNASFKKKLKYGGGNSGQKLKPPKEAMKQSSSHPEELEIEIAEVLFGLKTQSQAPSSRNEDSREVDRSNGHGKPHVSPPVSNCDSLKKQILEPDSNPLQPVASKRKRTSPENSSYGGSAKLDRDKMVKSEISSANLEKKSASNSERVSEIGDVWEAAAPPAEAVKMNLELKAAAGGLRESIDSDVKKDMSFSKEKKVAMRNKDLICMDTTATATAIMINANAAVSDVENQKQQKLEIDLMAPPAQEIRIHLKATATAADQISSLSIRGMELKPEDKVDEKRKIVKEQSENAVEEEAGLKKEINKHRSVVDMQLDLEKPVRNENAAVNSSANKLQLYKQQANREEPLSEKSSQSKTSIPLPAPMAGWACGLPPMGQNNSIVNSRFMAPLQGVVSRDGSTVAPPPIQPLLSQPRPKKCATHSYIARSIHCLQQAMKMNPFWHAAAGSTSLFGSKPANLNQDINNAPDKENDHNATGQMKQPILVQQPLPPVPATTKLLGPAFIFPLNHQQAAVSGRPSSAKSASVGGITNTSASAMSFSYPAMAANETQYLAIMQNNNAYPFPTPANYRGNLALLNGSLYSIHPPQQTPSVQSQKHLVGQQHRPQSSGANGNEMQSLAQPGFAISFGNGANTGAGIDTSSMAQNHVIMAAQNKAFRECEDEKSVGFSRLDSASAAVSSAQAMPINHIQGQLAATAAVNGSLLSEHLNSSSTTAAKIPAGFPQNFVQSSSSHSQRRSCTKTSASLFRSAQMQTQMSFGGNQKPSTCNSNNQIKNSPSIHATTSSSPPMSMQLFFSNLYSQAQDVKGGGTFLPVSFSYPHPLPAAEQKQPAG